MDTNNLSSRWTPINNSNPQCIQTDASLCIYNVDPDVITHKLGIEPTSCQAKGLPHTLPSGTTNIGKVNSWLLSSEKSVTAKSLRTHLNWLLDRIKPVTAQLKELQEIADIKMSVRCSWWSIDSDGATVVLWPEQMELLTKTNLEISMEISCWGDEEKEINGNSNDS